MDALPPQITTISDSEADDDPPELLDESDCGEVFWVGETGYAAPQKGKAQGKGKEKAHEPQPSVSFIEVFAGSGNLSAAVANRGMETMSWDLQDGPACDMSQDCVVQDLTDRAVLSGARYVHFAPPCNTYSTARWPRIR